MVLGTKAVPQWTFPCFKVKILHLIDVIPYFRGSNISRHVTPRAMMFGRGSEKHLCVELQVPFMLPKFTKIWDVLYTHCETRAEEQSWNNNRDVRNGRKNQTALCGEDENVKRLSGSFRSSSVSRRCACCSERLSLWLQNFFTLEESRQSLIYVWICRCHLAKTIPNFKIM